MIDGFIEIDRQTFCLDIYPAIKKELEALKSNLRAPRDEGEDPLLIIYWGTRDKIAESTKMLAVTLSDNEGPDRFWVAPHLL